MNNFFFSHFLLAHFLVDYPLQTDKLFETKVRKFKGVLVHSIILLFFLLVLSFPYTVNPLVIVSCFSIATLHLLQDQAKIYLTRKEEGENFYYFIGDQALHILLIFLFSFLPFPKVNYRGEGILRFYFDPFYSYLIIFIIGVTYFYWILLYSIDVSFLNKNPLVKGFWRYYGYCERLSAFFLSFFCPICFFIPYIFLIPRKFNKKPIFEGFLGISLSLFLGILLRWLK